MTPLPVTASSKIIPRKPAAASLSTAAAPNPAGRRITGRVRGEMHNRIRVLMIHAPRYSFQGQARLATDAGVSRSTISRLLSGQINPSFRLAQAMTAALETHLKRPLDPRDILSSDGSYPTPSGCALADCRGCMPEEAYDKDGCLKPDFRDLRPGDWSLARPSEPEPLTKLTNQKSNHQESNHQEPSNQGKETE